MTKFIEVTTDYNNEKYLININQITYISFMDNLTYIEILDKYRFKVKENYEQIKEMING